MVKNPPAMQETQVWSLGQDKSPKKEAATHSSILTCENSQTEEPGRLQSTASQNKTVSFCIMIFDAYFSFF